MNFLKVNLRIKLDSFIGTELESKIIDKINYIYKKVNYPFKLYLWFDDNKIISKNLNDIATLAHSQKEVMDYLLSKAHAPIPLFKLKHRFLSIYTIKN